MCCHVVSKAVRSSAPLKVSSTAGSSTGRDDLHGDRGPPAGVEQLAPRLVPVGVAGADRPVVQRQLGEHDVVLRGTASTQPLAPLEPGGDRLVQPHQLVRPAGLQRDPRVRGGLQRPRNLKRLEVADTRGRRLLRDERLLGVEQRTTKDRPVLGDLRDGFLGQCQHPCPRLLVRVGGVQPLANHGQIHPELRRLQT